MIAVDDESPTKAGRRLPLPLIATVTLSSLCVALLAAYVFVVRPAAQDDTIAVDDFVDSAGLTPDATEPAEVGKPAPAITLAGLDGPDIPLPSLIGKPVVLNFWASTCAPCVKEMPLLERGHQRYGDDVTFVGIDVFESEQLGRDMIERTGVTYQQARDPKSQVISQFGGINLPHTVIIDAEGVVSELHNRTITSDAELDELIAAAR